VANLTSQVQHLVIHDQIPISLHDRVVVRLDESTPQPSQVSEMGLLEWQLRSIGLFRPWGFGCAGLIDVKPSANRQFDDRVAQSAQTFKGHLDDVTLG
jgi:hypothetical protein